MHQRGETLIVIPCWWEGDEESLMETILHFRPELANTMSISKSNLLFFKKYSGSGSGAELSKRDPAMMLLPPTILSSSLPSEANYYFAKSSIPGVGELMLAVFPQPGKQYDNWWTSEKYDGVRACWNPKTKIMYSQSAALISNAVISCGSYFGLFPNSILLDGEIWYGRGYHNATFRSHHCNEHNHNEHHSEYHSEQHWMRFCVFDSPVDDLHYEHRYRLLCDNIPTDNNIVILVPQLHCASSEIGHIFLDMTQSLGEGLVRRQPRSMYEHGRSNALIKLKDQRDYEGLVIARNPDGTYKLQVAARRVVARAALSTKSSFEQPLQPGDWVIFTYRHINTATYGQPTTSASIVQRLSNAVSCWQSSKMLLPEVHKCVLPPKMTTVDFNSNIGNGILHQQAKISKQPPEHHYEYGHWTKEDSMRLYFDEYAAKSGFDPLVPDNWYHVLRCDVINEMKSFGAMAHRPFGTVLIESYPNIGLSPHCFLHRRKYWDKKQNRKLSINNIAQDMAIDPLIPNNWYTVSHNDITSHKAGYYIMDMYKESLSNALKDVYPNLEEWLQDDSFVHEQRRTRIKCLQGQLVLLAKQKGFDPLIATNWSLLSKHDIATIKKLQSGLRHLPFSNIVNKAFPEIQFMPLATNSNTSLTFYKSTSSTSTEITNTSPNVNYY
eukprot:Phypoly_transcript_02034.p1 GENE.Phypoly_transcript_02034~~Phypoly_transcript_02034.p1  ORF type:complete len:665 (+),score=45.46 Phypoly_transcript_02034:644-2638(+)